MFGSLMPKRLSYILLVFLFSQKLAAQPASDSSINNRISDIVEMYYQSLGDQSPLYNGSEYLEYSYTLQEGHPFFASPVWTKGTLFFDGMMFREVPMLYDIIKDQLVIPDFQQLNKINLPEEKIERFVLSGHTFVRLEPDSLGVIKTGFYELLHDGRTGLFARRQKKILEKAFDLRINNVVISQNTYYIRKGGKYHVVKNKADVLHVLKDKKKEIQQKLKTDGLKFKERPEQAMLIAVEYYDQLTK